MSRAAAAVALLALLAVAACGPDEAPEVEVPSWAHVAPEQIAEARKHGVPVAFENDLGMRFVLIPAGTFLMGSPEDEEGRFDDETVREVAISRPFYMSIYEVTNGQYRRFRPTHDSGVFRAEDLDGDRHPVVMVHVWEACEFADWIGEHDEERLYRLPTQEEWQYACRAGRQSAYWWGPSKAVGWRHANANDQTAQTTLGLTGHGWSRGDGYLVSAPVGSYEPSPWGLYDVHGNALEWCPSCHIDERMTTRSDALSLVLDVCGGSWRSTPRSVRAARQAWVVDDTRADDLGIRLVSPLPEPGE